MKQPVSSSAMPPPNDSASYSASRIPISRLHFTRGRAKIKRNVILCFLTGAAVSVAVVNSQATSSVCSCAPAVYQWKLDYSLVCPPEDVTQGFSTGISETVCYIRPEDNTVQDLQPVKTTMIQIFELDLNLIAVKTSVLPNLSLVDGDTFTFTSIVATEPDTIPGGLQMRIASENALGDIMYNDWIVRFTNTCSVKPFTTQDSLGWSAFYKLASPRSKLCPSDGDTSVPTTYPVVMPTRPPQKPARRPKNVLVTSSPIPASSSPTDYPVTPTRPPQQKPVKRPKNITYTPTPSPLKPKKRPKNPTDHINTSSPSPYPIKTRAPLNPTKRPIKLTVSPTTEEINPDTFSTPSSIVPSSPVVAPHSTLSVSYSYSYSYSYTLKGSKKTNGNFANAAWWHFEEDEDFQNLDEAIPLSNEFKHGNKIVDKRKKKSKKKKMTRRRIY